MFSCGDKDTRCNRTENHCWKRPKCCLPLPSPSHSPTLSGPARAKSATVNKIDGTREVPLKPLNSTKEEKKWKEFRDEETAGAIRREADMRQTFKRFGGLKKVSDG